MSEWIKCNERLPKVGMPVLYFQTWPEDTMFNCRADPLKSTHIGIGGLKFERTWVKYEHQYNDCLLKHVTHWMPLPEVPKNDI